MAAHTMQGSNGLHASTKSFVQTNRLLECRSFCKRVTCLNADWGCITVPKLPSNLRMPSCAQGLSLAPHFPCPQKISYTVRKWLAYLGKLVANFGCNNRHVTQGFRSKSCPKAEHEDEGSFSRREMVSSSIRVWRETPGKVFPKPQVCQGTSSFPVCQWE